jgi:TFIIF-interacting CTD phosphatase-like protein
LQQIDMGKSSKASVPMIHSVPELKVSEDLAKKLGKADTNRMLSDRKLALLVDLDQTLIHTTNDNVPNNLKVRSGIPLFLDDSVMLLILLFIFFRMYITSSSTDQIRPGTTHAYGPGHFRF